MIFFFYKQSKIIQSSFNIIAQACICNNYNTYKVYVNPNKTSPICSLSSLLNIQLKVFCYIYFKQVKNKIPVGLARNPILSKLPLWTTEQHSPPHVMEMLIGVW